jgi:hypothetical protein
VISSLSCSRALAAYVRWAAGRSGGIGHLAAPAHRPVRTGSASRCVGPIRAPTRAAGLRIDPGGGLRPTPHVDAPASRALRRVENVDAWTWRRRSTARDPSCTSVSRRQVARGREFASLSHSRDRSRRHGTNVSPAHDHPAWSYTSNPLGLDARDLSRARARHAVPCRADGYCRSPRNCRAIGPILTT